MSRFGVVRRRGIGAAVALSVPLLALLGACGRSEPAQPLTTDQVEIGRVVYASNCAVCHGPNGEGGVGFKLAGGATAKKYPDAKVTNDIVTKGRGAMPGWKDALSKEEIDAVVRYVREAL